MAASDESIATGIPLASVFSPECIVQIPGGATKQEVLQQLLRSLTNAGLLSQTEVPTILARLMERERVGSTALGKGLAIPHLRINSVDQFVGAIGLAPDGIDFKSLDGASTKLVLLVLGPYKERERHFELMGRLSAVLRDKTTLWFLQGRRTAEEVFEYLTEFDARSGRGPRSLAADVVGVGASQHAAPLTTGHP